MPRHLSNNSESLPSRILKLGKPIRCTAMAFIATTAPLSLRYRSFLAGSQAPAASIPRHVSRAGRVRMDATPDSSAKAVPQQSAKTSTEVPPFNWIDQWYPCAWTDDVPTLKPVPFSIWGRRYVLFRDRTTGTYVVMDDLCPHRAAPLSEGRLYERGVEDGGKETILECGYHGWRFNCSGRCVDIPVIDLERRIPAAADVGGVYATHVQAPGLIYVFLGDRAKADESKIPQSDTVVAAAPESIVWFRNVKRTMPTNFATITENIADPAHVQWAHHGTQGNRNTVPRNGNMEVSEVSSDGKIDGGIRIGDSPDYRLQVRYTAPSAMFYKVTKSPVGPFILLSWIVPTSHNSCDLFAVNAIVNPPWKIRLVKRFTPRWIEHTVSNTVLDGDTPMLRAAENHLQEMKRDGYGGAWKKQYVFRSGTWDNMVIKFREWLDKQAPFLPYATPLPAETPVEWSSHRKINDRYEHHTKDCGSCRPALENLRKALLVVLVAAGAAAATVLFSGLIYLALATGGARFLSQPLVIAGVAGLLSCMVLLAIAKKINHFISLLTYTDIGIERRLTES